MPFYSATGKLITKNDVKPEVASLKEAYEYKADGTLIIEKDEKEVAHPGVAHPSAPKFFNIPKKMVKKEEE